MKLPEHTLTVYNHPEPHSHRWSDLELKAIKRYAEAYALQAVERESFMAGYATQEQLYVERERHTAEVKKLQAEIGRLQAEIGRLQALSPVAMTEEDMLACMAAATHEVPTRIPQGWRKVMRAVEAHHGITQKEQGTNRITAQGAQEGV